jgi:DNA helicase HerA-like ATPase
LPYRLALRDMPVQFWDLFGDQGHPIRTTVSEMGPLLLCPADEPQRGPGRRAHHRLHVADKEGLLLLDLDDLQAMLVQLRRTADELTLEYGNVSKQSVGAIQRSLLQLRSQGGEHFFGEPALDLEDFIEARRQGPRHRQHPRRRQADGQPRLYSTFLLWLLSRAVRAASRSRRSRQAEALLLLRRSASAVRRRAPALLEKVEQVVRLIRSKGVGVYFITQNPIDIPTRSPASSTTASSTS